MQNVGHNSMKSRKLPYKLFLIAVNFSLLVIFPGLSFSCELLKLCEYSEIKEWHSTFFVSDAPVELNVSGKLTLNNPSELLEPFKKDGEEAYYYKCNKENELCIRITFDFEIISENNEKILAGLDPDSFVDLVDYKRNKVHRLFGIGSVGRIIGAFWDSNKILIYGFAEEAGFVTILDLDRKSKITYVISKDFRKKGVSVTTFLIKKYG